ncbi:MAG: STAS domain-containing protein, partial [Planctomycetota bacterium]|nr:STAS domain-containing protein [Planctomycetota bacterium]
MSDAQELEIQTESSDDGVILRPCGEIDLNCAAVLREQLRRAQDGRPERLVVDLGGVPYMDSSGVATLVEAMQVARRTSTKL